MKTLIEKELREQLKVGLLGLTILTLLLAGTFRDSMQPVLENMTGATLLFCASFGALLGWLQAHKENHRDLWAFLIHRPISPTSIFACKVIAGMGIYFLAVGVPLVGLMVLANVPGLVAAPFEWAMTLPAAACFLAGIACYFAGMLTGLRQARWYASRGLGLGAAFLVSIAVLSPQFWQALVCILIGGGILTMAAWGSFKSGGYYRGAPAAGKLALTASMAAGSVVVTLFMTTLLVKLAESLAPSADFGPPRYSYYVMAKDGTIWKVIFGGDRPAEYVGLDGKAIINPNTGKTIEPEGVNEWLSPTFPMGFGDHRHPRGSYSDTSRFFIMLIPRQGSDTRWYFSYQYDRILGYDLKSRRFLGSIGPKGFVKSNPLGGDRFDPPSGSLRTLTASNLVYLLDFEKATATILFTLPEGEHAGASADISRKGYGWDYTAVVTERSVYLLTPEGKLEWKVPFEPGPPNYSRVQLSLLEPPDQFALWIAPDSRINPKLADTLPTHVIWLTRGQGVVKSMDLPVLPKQAPFVSLEERAMNVALPPLVATVLAVRFPQVVSWETVQIGLVGAAICAAAGWWLGRRYKARLGKQLGWGIFHLAFGLGGFLAFLSVQEWPAREKCPQCKNLRTVEQDRCEHCGANFAPPERNGTEIMEERS